MFPMKWIIILFFFLSMGAYGEDDGVAGNANVEAEVATKNGEDDVYAEFEVLMKKFYKGFTENYVKENNLMKNPFPAELPPVIFQELRKTPKEKLLAIKNGNYKPGGYSEQEGFAERNDLKKLQEYILTLKTIEDKDNKRSKKKTLSFPGKIELLWKGGLFFVLIIFAFFLVGKMRSR